MDITRSQLEKIIKEELEEQGIELNEIEPVVPNWQIGAAIVGAIATVFSAACVAPVVAAAGAACVKMNKREFERIKRQLKAGDMESEEALAATIATALTPTLVDPKTRKPYPQIGPEKIQDKIKEEIARAVTAAQSAAPEGAELFNKFTFEQSKLSDAKNWAGLQPYTTIAIQALRDNGVRVESDTAVQSAISTGREYVRKTFGENVQEVKMRKGLRHYGTTAVATAAGAALGFFLGGLSGPATGLGAGVAAGSAARAGNEAYDKYLLKKIATESDILAAGLAVREQVEESEEPWDVDSWLESSLSKLTPKQRKSVIYEEAEFLLAGRKHGEEELANQIVDYLAKEGMLDNEERPQLPAEEIPQIGVQDEMPGEEERMVAESFGRMNQLAGVIKG